MRFVALVATANGSRTWGGVCGGWTVPTSVGPIVHTWQAVGSFLPIAQDRLRNSRHTSLTVRAQPLLTAIGNRRKSARTVKHFTKLTWGAINVRTMDTKINNQGGELVISGASATKPFDVCALLSQHDIGLCAMSEVRWKGSGSIRLDKHLCLFSGLPPDVPVSLSGVAIVLNEQMQRAWERAGSEVVFHNERLMKIVLEVEGRRFHVVSVYAPTFRASEQEKERFYADLDKTISDKKSGEELLTMGDFNARVGTRDSQMEGAIEAEEGDAKELVLGKFGLPELNDNGRLLLDFCRSRKGQSYRVMSTYYKQSSYGTWQHNRTNSWHQIDHIVEAASTAAFFTDVRVMPGLGFDFDHRLVRSSLRVMRRCKQPWGNRGGGIHGGFSLNKRMPELDLSKLGDETKVSNLNKRFEDLLSEGLVDEYELWARGLRKLSEKVLASRKPSFDHNGK